MKTSIAWTDFSFNPWWGCVRVSPGCEHCYAEAFSHRLGLDLWGPTSPRRFFGDKHWNEPVRWNRTSLETFGRPARVFCASMADVFEDRRDLDEHRARLWALIEATPNLVWQVLTKRPENAAAFVPEAWTRRGWPGNTWALTTAEDQARADLRIPELLAIPARVRGVSYEPALGPIDFSRWLVPRQVRDGYRDVIERFKGKPGFREDKIPAHLRLRPSIDWVIVGGESGLRARPLGLAWALSAIEQCRAAGCAAFMKQTGRWIVGDHDGFVLDRWLVDEGRRVWVPPVIGDRAFARPNDAVAFSIGGKGDDPRTWPEALRVQEFPA